jgi:hypothetical protein
MGNGKREVAIWVLVCALAAPAHASNTCDEKTPETCCGYWTADLLDGQRKWGAVTESTFADLQARVDETRKTLASLCRAYGAMQTAVAVAGEQEVRTCGSQVVQMRCAEPSEFVDNRLTSAGDRSAARKRLLENELLRIGRTTSRIERLQQIIAATKPRVLWPDPYLAFDSVLKKYRRELDDTFRSVRALQAQLSSRSASEWSAGDHDPSSTRDGEAESLIARHERMTAVVDGMVGALHPENYEEDLTFAPRETGHSLTTDDAGRLFQVNVDYIEKLGVGQPAEPGGLSKLSSSMITADTPGTYTVAQWAYDCHDGSSGRQDFSHTRWSGYVCVNSSLKSLSLLGVRVLPVED